jgi:hypothetical protein
LYVTDKLITKVRKHEEGIRKISCFFKFRVFVVKKFFIESEEITIKHLIKKLKGD